MPYQVLATESPDEVSEQMESVEESNDVETKTVSVGENTEVVVNTYSNKIVSETYVNGEFLDKTVAYKDSGKMIYTDSEGNVEESIVSDYVVQTSDESVAVENSTDSNRISIQANGSKYSTLYGHEYSSAYGENGYLYGVRSVTTGPKQDLRFNAGTAVSTISSAIELGVAISTGGLYTIIRAVGGTIVNGALGVAVAGEIFTETERYDYEAVSQGEVGLTTYTEEVRGKIIDSSNGNVEWIDLYSGGDSRSRSDLIHAGIYNVYVRNN